MAENMQIRGWELLLVLPTNTFNKWGILNISIVNQYITIQVSFSWQRIANAGLIDAQSTVVVWWKTAYTSDRLTVTSQLCVSLLQGSNNNSSQTSWPQALHYIAACNCVFSYCSSHCSDKLFYRWHVSNTVSTKVFYCDIHSDSVVIVCWQYASRFAGIHVVFTSHVSST